MARAIAGQHLQLDAVRTQLAESPGHKMLLDWACAWLGTKVPDSPQLAKGAFWVLHIDRGTAVSAERYQPSRPDSGMAECARSPGRG